MLLKQFAASALGSLRVARYDMAGEPDRQEFGERRALHVGRSTSAMTSLTCALASSRGIHSSFISSSMTRCFSASRTGPCMAQTAAMVI